MGRDVGCDLGSGVPGGSADRMDLEMRMRCTLVFAPTVGTAPRRIAVVLDGPATPIWQQRAPWPAWRHRLRSRLSKCGSPEPAARGRLRRAHAAIERHLFALGPDALAPVPLDRTDADAPALVPLDRVDIDVPSERADGGAELVVWLSELAPPPIDEPRDLIHLRHGRPLEPAEEAFRRAALRGVPCVETEVLLRSGGRSMLLERTVSGSAALLDDAQPRQGAVEDRRARARAAERAPGLEHRRRRRALPAGPAPSTAELLMRSPLAWSRDRGGQAAVRPARGGSGCASASRGTDGADGRGRTSRWCAGGRVTSTPTRFCSSTRGAITCSARRSPPGARRAVISHTELRPDAVGRSRRRRF